MADFEIATEAGFGHFVRRWRPRLLHFLTRRNVLRADAEHLCQEAFLILCRKRLRPVDDPRKLLYGIANRLTLAYHRTHSRNRAALKGLDGGGIACAGDRPNDQEPDDQGGAASSTVEGLLIHLTPRQREVIDLVWIGQLSRRDAADRLGLTLNALYVHEKNALDRLREAHGADGACEGAVPVLALRNRRIPSAASPNARSCTPP